MKNSINKILTLLSICIFVVPAAFAADSNLETARKNIVKQFPGVVAKNITASPVSGLYQVSMPPRFFMQVSMLVTL